LIITQNILNLKKINFKSFLNGRLPQIASLKNQHSHSYILFQKIIVVFVETLPFDLENIEEEEKKIKNILLLVFIINKKK
jgi:hypothetical protein